MDKTSGRKLTDKERTDTQRQTEIHRDRRSIHREEADRNSRKDEIQQHNNPNYENQASWVGNRQENRIQSLDSNNVEDSLHIPIRIYSVYFLIFDTDNEQTILQH